MARKKSCSSKIFGQETTKKTHVLGHVSSGLGAFEDHRFWLRQVRARKGWPSKGANDSDEDLTTRMFVESTELGGLKVGYCKKTIGKLYGNTHMIKLYCHAIS